MQLGQHWCGLWLMAPKVTLTLCGLVTSCGNMEPGQHWLRWWLVAWRHQAITWTNVDLSSVRSNGIHKRYLSHQSLKLAWKLPNVKSCRGQWVNNQWGNLGSELVFKVSIVEMNLNNTSCMGWWSWWERKEIHVLCISCIFPVMMAMTREWRWQPLTTVSTKIGDTKWKMAKFSKLWKEQSSFILLELLRYLTHVYCRTSNISCTKSPNLNVLSSSCFIALSIEVENEHVGAAPTGDAPTTYEWSTVLLLIEVCLILGVWQ